ncbi:MAG: hypothetical protein IJZ08_03290 [Clostridia bacterium]|nr:hypothetical protein [Clostridia bacterium]
MEYKRITLFAGHYGSGKTNIAVNYAIEMRKAGRPVRIADLDIVNPYFRTKDSADRLAEAGIELISSAYANSNVDIPALPAQMYALTDDKSFHAVMDIGGDDRGALALGRYAPAILAEGDFEMLFVANMYRPLTRTPAEALEVMREVEDAGGIPFTAIVNNSNIGAETKPEDILASVSYAEELSRLSGLPVKMTAVREDLMDALSGKIENLFPLTLQKKYAWN